ncbi:hypothetical protein C8T65DRAFT_280323 [Cerioporus squamosus]|nr:hypothetical protein C8T65DRAFT_280323 [Cerioporus squamosus]
MPTGHIHLGQWVEFDQLRFSAARFRHLTLGLNWSHARATISEDVHTHFLNLAEGLCRGSKRKGGWMSLTGPGGSTEDCPLFFVKYRARQCTMLLHNISQTASHALRQDAITSSSSSTVTSSVSYKSNLDSALTCTSHRIPQHPAQLAAASSILTMASHPRRTLEVTSRPTLCFVGYSSQRQIHSLNVDDSCIAHTREIIVPALSWTDSQEDLEHYTARSRPDAMLVARLFSAWKITLKPMPHSRRLTTHRAIQHENTRVGRLQSFLCCHPPSRTSLPGLQGTNGSVSWAASGAATCDGKLTRISGPEARLQNAAAMQLREYLRDPRAKGDHCEKHGVLRETPCTLLLELKLDALELAPIRGRERVFDVWCDSLEGAQEMVDGVRSGSRRPGSLLRAFGFGGRIDRQVLSTCSSCPSS